MERYIKGVGMTKFGVENRTSASMSYEAIQNALKDSGMGPNDIDAVVASSEVIKLNGEKQRLFTSIISSILRRKLPIIKVPAVCGGGGAALWTALRLKYNNVLVVAADKIVGAPTPIITDGIMTAGERRWEQEEGLVFPAQNALVAQDHMQKYGTTKEDLHLIAYKNHFNGAMNPKARFFGKKVTMETIRESPIVASPFNLYDCSISVNGAASVIISNDKSKVKVIGSALATDYLPPFEREDMSRWESIIRAGKDAFAMAGIEPSDIDVAELHDAFSIVELMSYEDLGFCKKGDGKEMIRSGRVNLDGKMPVNTSGGLKARGHPISPTGVAQVVEITEQLRGMCGERQVNNPIYGLAHNIGGAGGTSTAHIFKKV